eukprot:scaffold13491_cov110-Skeletonema_dohrnii-CCMP3373.AAC.1
MATNTNPGNRKRPAPTQPPPPSSNNVTTSLRIDALLAKYARHLPPGGTISIQLTKGGTSTSVDPIAVRKAVSKKERQLQKNNNSGVSSGNDSDNGGGMSAAAATAARVAKEKLTLPFPRVAKFPETITRPNFITGGLRDGRMYEEEVPLAKDESDEDEATAYRSPEDGSGPPKKKKRRWRRHDARPRRWVLQEKVEFFEKIAANRRKQKQGLNGGGGSGDTDDEGGNKLSNQYHGVVESNASKYVMLTVAPSAAAASIPPPQTGSSNVVAPEQITIQPIFGFHTFSQPYKTASLSMEDAEAAIEQQRNTVTRYMMHGKQASSDKDEAAAAAIISSGVRGPAPKALSRARLLGKLASNDNIDEGDDVMGDIKFETKRGGGGARKELLSSMADEGLTMDDDGVIGGANDTEFGGKRRFGRAAVDKAAEASANKKGGGGAATGFEAGAMEEGFYQRDVGAEYEALDYDANEQFDDDDVNLGEDEVMDDGGGFGGDYDSADDVMSDDDSDDDIGIATSAGLKAMLAKARGESPVNEVADGTGAPDANAASQSSNGTEDASKKAAGAKQSNGTSASNPPPAAAKPIAKEAVGVEIGADGKRKITLEAVRREIWLNSGSIKTKKLRNKFDVSTQFPERMAVFRKIVQELCTLKKDADGTKLVLKQHYAK